MDIIGYFTKARQLWDESSAVSAVPKCIGAKCECGINGKLQKYTKEQRLIRFLMGLNSRDSAVRANILMMSPFPAMSQAYSLLVQEERQRQLTNEAHFLNENASLSAGVNKPVLEKFDAKKSTLFCDHCK